ncbi:hypothetical protein [Streptomyces sp. YS-3]|uniref:hypothetical protein n=1 Tax=Streptomyces sp. YS-3 TaxID=3381352 RepID=UPI00386E9979
MDFGGKPTGTVPAYTHDGAHELDLPARARQFPGPLSQRSTNTTSASTMSTPHLPPAHAVSSCPGELHRRQVRFGNFPRRYWVMSWVSPSASKDYRVRRSAVLPDRTTGFRGL